MRVSGVHSGHDPSGALVVDRKIVAEVIEEKFPRIKYAGLSINKQVP